MNQTLIYKIKKIPKQPGIYIWKNRYDEAIYVGKAKNLFNRVHQYLHKNEYRIKKLVDESTDIDFIVVNNEKRIIVIRKQFNKKTSTKIQHPTKKWFWISLYCYYQRKTPTNFIYNWI